MLNWVWVLNIWSKRITNGWTGKYKINVFRYISKWGFGVYNWKPEGERKSIAWMSVAEVKDVLKYSGAFPRIVLNIWTGFWYKTRSENVIHLNSDNIIHDGV